jgi:hypothetical protein
VTSEGELKDQGLNHLLQQKFVNQILNLKLQDQHFKLLTKRGDYDDYLQWETIEESKNLKGCFVDVLMLNPMHLDHENMQQVVLFGDERWDEIQSRIEFDQAFDEN